MIGDIVRYLSVVNAQVKPIGVNWGYHVQELEAAGAAAILGSFHDLDSTLQILWGTDNASLTIGRSLASLWPSSPVACCHHEHRLQPI